METMINEYGSRLNRVEVDLGKTKVKVERTEEDIGEIRGDVRRLFEGQNSIRSTLSKGLGALAILYVVLQVTLKVIEIPEAKKIPQVQGGTHEKATTKSK